MADIQFSQSRRLKCLGVEFIQLMLQPVLPILHIPACQQGGTFFLQRFPLFGVLLNLMQKRWVTGKLIQ